MGFHVAYGLASALYGDGYALKHAWLQGGRRGELIRRTRTSAGASPVSQVRVAVLGWG